MCSLSVFVLCVAIVTTFFSQHFCDGNPWVPITAEDFLDYNSPLWTDDQERKRGPPGAAGPIGPTVNNYEKYSKTMNATLDRLKSDVDRNGESLKEVKSNVTMIQSTLTELELEVKQMKKQFALAHPTKNDNKKNNETVVSAFDKLESHVAHQGIEDLPARQLVLAALNEPHTGDMNGRAGADSLCLEQARAAGFNSTFKSFLGDTEQSLYTNVPPELRNLAIVNTLGEKIFSSWDSLFSGDQGKFDLNTHIYNFYGEDVLIDHPGSSTTIWHGALPNGNASIYSCNSWKPNSARSRGLASYIYDSKLLTQRLVRCTAKHIVLCIQNSIAWTSACSLNDFQ